MKSIIAAVSTMALLVSVVPVNAQTYTNTQTTICRNGSCVTNGAVQPTRTTRTTARTATTKAATIAPKARR